MQRNKSFKRKRNSKGRTRHFFIYLCVLVIVVASAVHFFKWEKLIGGVSLYHQSAPTKSSGTDQTVEKGLADDGKEVIKEETWCLTLVNKDHPIPDDYKVELMKLNGGESVDKRIYPALQEMFDAARGDGIYPIVASGYRTAKEQKKLMEDKIEAYKAEGNSVAEAKKMAEMWVAVPGTSEHQLGLAVDINADGIHSTGNEVYKWMKKNAHLYGFIFRYPPEKTEITGVLNEPWHYRYVGVKAATEIYNQGICLEEYLNKNDSGYKVAQ